METSISVCWLLCCVRAGLLSARSEKEFETAIDGLGALQVGIEKISNVIEQYN